MLDDILTKVEREGDATIARTMLYVDDILVWGENSNKVQDKIDQWSVITKECGMKISKENGESLLMHREDAKVEQRKLNGKELEEKKEFKYLQTIVKDGKCHREIRKRILHAGEFYLM